MNLDLVDLVGKYRKAGNFDEGTQLGLGILASYGLDLESFDMTPFSDYTRDKLIALYYELSILLHYGPENMRKHCRYISDRLLYTKGINVPYNNISENRRFLVEQISSLIDIKEVQISFSPPQIPNTNQYFRTLNPSIVSMNGKYYINIRCVNYNNDRCINFTAVEGSYNNKIVTRNFLIELDENFSQISTREMINQCSLEMKRDAVQGLEDVHLFSHHNKLHFVCSTYYTSSNGVDVCHGVVNIEEKDIILKDVKIINYFGKQGCEKNWLAFIKDDAINYLYSQQPVRILRDDGNECKQVLKKENTINAGLHRGSGGPIPYKNGYLITSHEVVWNGDGRTYMHKFIQYDKDFNIVKVSLPFKFSKANVDYCRSMTYSLDKKSILLGVGIADKEFKIFSFDVQELDKILYEPHPFILKRRGITTISIFNASHVTREIDKVVYNYFYKNFSEKYKIDRCKELKYQEENVLYVVICPAGLHSFECPKNYIVYQLDQSVYNTHMNKNDYLQFLNNARCIFDYSKMNIEYLNKKGIDNTLYFPIAYDESLTIKNLGEYNDVGKDIDVLFLGWTLPNSRRSKISDDLKSKGYNVVFIWDKTPLEMQELIVRSKVCLNIHTYDQGILETARLSNYLANRACVVSELCLDTDMVDIYSKHGVTFVLYDSLCDKVIEFLSNQNIRSHLAETSFQWYKSFYTIHNLFPPTEVEKFL
jgi:hypothetical protein